MSDKDKLEIINQMIANYYEFLYEADPDKNGVALGAIVACIDAVINHEPTKTTEGACGGSCGGSCEHGCKEQ